MGFLRRVFGGKDEQTSSSGAAVDGPRVSGNRYWRCPNCGGVQSKKELDTTYQTGTMLAAGALVACAKCGREHDVAAVYGGSLDFTGEAEVLSRAQVAQRYLDAEVAQDGDALEALLAPDAVHTSMRGDTAGAKAIADRLRNPQGMGAGMMGRLQWGAPAEADGVVTVDGKPTMPNAPFPGLTLTLRFNEANKITRIEMGRKEG